MSQGQMIMNHGSLSQKLNVMNSQPPICYGSVVSTLKGFILSLTHMGGVSHFSLSLLVIILFFFFFRLNISNEADKVILKS